MNRQLWVKCIGFAPCLLFTFLCSRPALADFATHAKAPGTMPGDTLVTGASHTCIVEPDGELWCWGENFYGQIGDGTSVSTNRPYDTGPALTEVVFAAASAQHTCGRLLGQQRDRATGRFVL
ncbi:MAG: hypothetical protein HY744_04605 [Deltaproteobacteria bacterium]|nr:hypothetical protein [Deltaproteobacteria bacterium]